MAYTIDSDARARAAEALRRMIGGSDSFSLSKSFVSGIKTRDTAVRAVLKAAHGIAKAAAMRSRGNQDAEQTAGMSFSDDERKQIEYYILFLESGAEMVDTSTKIQGRMMWIAVGAYVIPVIIETVGFWFVLRNLRGAFCAALVVSAFIYALAVFGLMIGSVPKERRRAHEPHEELEGLGVSSLWPFASIGDLQEALKGL